MLTKQDGRIVTGRTLALVIAAALFTGVAGLSLSALGPLLPVLTILAAVAQIWWPRLGTWLTFAFVVILSLSTMPFSFLVIKDVPNILHSLHRVHNFNYMMISAAWILSGPLLACCILALSLDISRAQRRRKVAPTAH